MRELQLLVIFIVNIIVLTSCTETTKNVTTVEKATATAQASSSAGDGNATATATASAKATVVKTTTVTKDDDDSAGHDYTANNSTDTGNNNNNGNCSATAIKRGTTRTGTFAMQYLSELLKWNCNATAGASLSTFYLFTFIGLYTQENSLAYNQTLNFTGMPDKETIRCVYEFLNTYLEDQPDGVTYIFSDNVEADYSDNFTQTFKDDAKSFLLGNAFNYETNKPKLAQKYSNDVIANDTNNYIENAILCSDIFNINCSIGKKLVFTSGDYYMARWRKEFVPAGKKNYTDMYNNTYLVDYVMQCDTYSYVDSDLINAEVIVIDGAKIYFKIVFFIPRKGFTLEDMIEKLADADVYEKVMGSIKNKTMMTYLPKYSSVTTVVNNVNVVKQMGYLSAYFDPKQANIIDANGINRLEYVERGSSKVMFDNTLDGDESNNNDECSGDNVTELLINRPAAYIVSTKQDLIILCGIAKVDT